MRNEAAAGQLEASDETFLPPELMMVTKPN